VQLVEADAGLAQALQAALLRLHAQNAVAVQAGDALAFLRAETGESFDIAFVDPPFAAGLWPEVLALLPAKMAAESWLYLESPAAQSPQMPADWALHRENQTRDVRYALYRRVTIAQSQNSGNAPTT
jgi:16S rRNA (guanine966-N2)-methyltransferase